MRGAEAQLQDFPPDEQTGLNTQTIQKLLAIDPRTRANDKSYWVGQVKKELSSLLIQTLVNSLRLLHDAEKENVNIDSLCNKLNDALTYRSDAWSDKIVERVTSLNEKIAQEKSKSVISNEQQKIRRLKMTVIYEEAVAELKSCGANGSKLVLGCQVLLISAFKCDSAATSYAKRQAEGVINERQRKSRAAKKDDAETINANLIKLTNKHMERGNMNDPVVKAKIDKERQRDVDAFKRASTNDVKTHTFVGTTRNYERVQNGVFDFIESKMMRTGGIILSKSETEPYKRRLEEISSQRMKKTKASN
eukprot:scaffold50732_cov63-Cyclotella_meneghiniana.AAC.4